MSTPQNHEIHVAGPDGTIIMRDGAYAGLRAKVFGGTVVHGSQVTVVHHEPTIPVMFDAGHAKILPPDPIAALAQQQIPALPKVEEPKAIVGESFKSSMPTSTNPWADLQVTVDDDEELVVAEIIEECELTPAEANASNDLSTDELIEMLTSRDLAQATMTAEEFNALKLTKRQLWKLYEQVCGRGTNKVSVPQAIEKILKSANTNAANYTRVVAAVRRVREQD
jgi:hypothetical protein